MAPTSLRSRLALGLLICAASAHAAVLPEDRGDLMYHSYDGGNVTVDGPSILVRKKIGEVLSISANYYVDMVTSASIDVEVLGASEYKEERKQSSASVEYLRGKTTYSLSFIDSVESDYTAQTAAIGISEDMFGDLTTISLGFSRAWDKVYRNVKQPDGTLQNQADYGGAPGVAYKPVDHRSYRLGLSQIITKSLIVGLNYESQSHEGQLGNPYRAYRHLTPGGGQAFAEEVYPGTRTTNAIAVDGRYYLPYRAAVNAKYRYFTDTWGIAANTFEVGYTHPWRDFIFEASYRSHSQEAADFYADLFPRRNAQNFMARDRNLATMTNRTIHVGITYDLAKTEEWTRSWLNKGTVNLYFDHIQFDFEDFRDARYSNASFTPTPTAIGQEPLYSEDANVIRFFISVWF